MITEDKIRAAENWFRQNDELAFDSDSEGLQHLRDVWQALREGWTLKKDGKEDAKDNKSWTA